MTRLGQMLVNDGIEQGIESAIINTIKICERLGNSKEDVISQIADSFEKGIDESREMVEKYWGKWWSDVERVWGGSIPKFV